MSPGLRACISAPPASDGAAKARNGRLSGPPSPAPHGSRLFLDFFFLAGPLRLNAETCKNVPRARGPGAAAWDGPGPAVRPALPFPRPVPCHPSAGPSAPAPRAPAIAAHCCPCPWRPPSLLNSVHPRLPQRCPSALSMALCPFLFISWNSTGRQAL